MAEKRMFSKKIIDTDWFMDMPASTQNLYFHLSMRADDDGFVSSPKGIIKLVGASDDDFRVLISKKFIIPFESGVCVITDWRINNYLRNDRHTDTIHKEELQQLSIDENGKYSLGIPGGIPTVYPVYTESISNTKSISTLNNKEDNFKKDSFIPPTLEEVKEYAESRGRGELAEQFFEYFNAGNWYDSKGNKVKRWKQKFLTWESFKKTKESPGGHERENTPSLGKQLSDGVWKI